MTQFIPVVDQALAGPFLFGFGHTILAVLTGFPFTGGGIQSDHEIGTGCVTRLLNGL